VAVTRGSPPSARGIPLLTLDGASCTRITPERAGNTGTDSAPHYPTPDHPRARGEYSEDWRDIIALPGSPPSARGIRSKCVSPGWRDGITPERAGNTVKFSWRCAGRWDHPRARGEYFPSVMDLVYAHGSPPSARGIRPRSAKPSGTPGITPERAGNTYQPRHGYVFS